MVSVRPSSDGPQPPPPQGAAASPGQPLNRLNLLLSCASWRSDSWADRLPCLLEPMGVHSVRARSARQAEKVIKSVPVHIAVVDLGLPLDERRQTNQSGPGEEAGPRVLELLARLESPPPTVVVKGTRSTRDNSRELAAALRSGAFAVVDRTAVDVEQMLEVLRRCLLRFYRGQWPAGGPAAPGTACGGGDPSPPGGPVRRAFWFHWSMG